MESAPEALLDAIVDGGEYRCHFSNRTPWNGTAHRTDDGGVTLAWYGATPVQDRSFRLATEGDAVVVIGKPGWGHLIKLTPRRSGQAKQPRPKRPDDHRSRPDRAERLASAVALTRLALGSTELLDAHRRQVLSLALWFVTEVDGKYKLRYRSMNARELTGLEKRILRHDHVLTRKRLIDQMIREPERAEQTLLSAFACVVTDEEHRRLTAIGETQEGWDRYIAAGIDVFDEQEGIPLIEHGIFLNAPDQSDDQR